MDKEKDLIVEALKNLTEIASEQTKVIVNLATENKLLEKRIKSLENKDEEKVVDYVFRLIGKGIMISFGLSLVITFALWMKGEIPIR